MAKGLLGHEPLSGKKSSDLTRRDGQLPNMDVATEVKALREKVAALQQAAQAATHDEGTMGRSKIIMPMVLAPGLSPGMAAVACAHASLAAYLTWREDPIVHEWLANTFYKRIFQAPTAEVWAAVVNWPDAYVLTESRLDNRATIAVFKPQRWSSENAFSALPLYPAVPKAEPPA